jgi:hypothetical protein
MISAMAASWAREGRNPHRRLSPRKIVFLLSEINAWLASGYTVPAVSRRLTMKRGDMKLRHKRSRYQAGCLTTEGRSNGQKVWGLSLVGTR